MKIPSRAKHVFKGVLFDIFQWTQKVYNGEDRLFEALRHQDGAVIIPVDSEGNVYYA
ncbi:MAG: hypothetical protein JXR30_03865 [Alphaproteobacteria bacterium]|nr:hypothetical protein [Alphaproteobacteria bacterium]